MPKVYPEYFNVKYNTILDLMSKEEAEQYMDTPHDLRSAFLQPYLARALEKDPEYEVFLPHYQFVHYHDYKDQDRVYEVPGCFVSNLGNVWNSSTCNLSPGHNRMRSKPLSYCFRTGHIRYAFEVHRAVAAIFIPTTIAKPYWDLLPAHKCRNRRNNTMDNLEWVLPKPGSMMWHPGTWGLEPVPETTVE